MKSEILKIMKSEILKIILNSQNPLRLPEIEFELKKIGFLDLCTFDVRDIIAELIDEQKIVFVPGRLVISKFA